MRAFDRPPLRTARLVLRPLAEADIGALYRLHADPQAMRYWSTPPWTDDAPARAMVAADQDAEQTGHLRLGLESLASGELLGTCSLFRFDAECRRAELGYMLGAPGWGQGLMHEALSALLDFAFAQWDLLRIEADTDPRNTRSMRLLERLHFVKEGHLRERWIVGGEVCDTALYGLLRRDWASGTA